MLNKNPSEKIQELAVRQMDMLFDLVEILIVHTAEMRTEFYG